MSAERDNPRLRIIREKMAEWCKTHPPKLVVPRPLRVRRPEMERRDDLPPAA